MNGGALTILHYLFNQIDRMASSVRCHCLHGCNQLRDEKKNIQHFKLESIKCWFAWLNMHWIRVLVELDFVSSFLCCEIF